MTEAEIMKEIETLLQIAKFVNSDYVTSPFETKVLIAIQDLINRKNAEIERLSNFVTEERCREIAREMIPKFVGQAKAEAIKEVLQRARGKVCCIPQHHFTLEQVLCDLDQIAEEMGGGVVSEHEEYFEDDYPCNHCYTRCDGWDARYCCTLCHYNGDEDCENCNSLDI